MLNMMLMLDSTFEFIVSIQSYFTVKIPWLIIVQRKTVNSILKVLVDSFRCLLLIEIKNDIYIKHGISLIQDF